MMSCQRLGLCVLVAVALITLAAPLAHARTERIYGTPEGDLYIIDQTPEESRPTIVLWLSKTGFSALRANATTAANEIVDYKGPVWLLKYIPGGSEGDAAVRDAVRFKLIGVFEECVDKRNAEKLVQVDIPAWQYQCN